MKIGVCIGVLLALLLHASFIVFGGWFFLDDDEGHGTMQEVELLSDDEVEQEEKKPEEAITESVAEPSESESDQAPEATEIVRALDMAESNEMPELQAASLSAIEAALSGQSGGGDFAQALDFASGGHVSGTGRVGMVGGVAEDPFATDEVDQAARLVVQVAPLYPSEMRGKKIEGHVLVTFFVDADGKVSNAKAAEASHEAFAKPALDAVKKWKYEPALRAGQRVPTKARVSIRFPIPN